MPELPSERPRLPFKIDDRIDPTLGVPLMIEIFRHVGAERGPAP